MKCHIPKRDVYSDKPTESWWVNPATFYAEARARFPETGAGQIDRRQMSTWADTGPAMSSRLSEFRREHRGVRA